MRSTRRSAALLAAIVLLSACSMPRGAAMQSEILRNAEAETPGFSHYPVDSALLAEVAHWPAAKHAPTGRTWVKGGVGGPGQVIVAGDAVQLAVWEGGENKLLTNPGAPLSDIPVAVVAPSGSIFVPYVGPVKVAGLSLEAARSKVQAEVSKLIPEAQVQMSAVPGKANTVSLLGGVANPHTVPLVDRSMTVLALIGEGGGVSPSIENPQLRLLRGGKVYEISLQRVLEDPTLDAGLRPGDKLSVEKDRRQFLALGAAGSERLVPFPKDSLNALEAVTLAGGINDSRADPKGVLVLREYLATAVRQTPAEGPQTPRAVFSINLTTAEGLFAAQNFAIVPNDVVLATESPVVNTRTILGLFGSTLGLARTADAIGE